MSTEQVASPIFVLVNGRKQDGAVKFDHKWKAGGAQWKSGDIVVDAGTPQHEIVFEVDPESSKKLRFVDDPNDAIWVGASKCPKQASNEGDQIRPIAVEGNGTRLRVSNANRGDPHELHYALRFKRKIPILLKPHKYDPVI